MPETPPLPIAADRQYLCPGERSPVSRAVHLARLAAGFAGCRECPLREGDAPYGSAVRPPSRLVTAEGVRGTWRNEFDPGHAAKLAAALAATLWEDAPGGPPAAGFPVVVGYDDRPWSAELAAAAGAELRRCGCETIDVGLATGPAFRFAVAHLDAAGGMLATGAGLGPAGCGFDLAAAGGRPLSRDGGLDRLTDFADRPRGRPTRRGGGRREFDAATPYEAGLRRHLRAFAPVTAVVGTASPLVRRGLDRLAADLPGRLTVLSLPQRPVDSTGAEPAGMERIAVAVRESGADLGVWIEEGGTACRVIDDAGRAVPVAEVAAMLLLDALAERPGESLLLDWPLAERLAPRLSRRGGEVARGGGSMEAMFGAMRDHRAAAGADSSGRFWLPGPTGDALATVARLLRVVGSSGEPLSARRHDATR